MALYLRIVALAAVLCAFPAAKASPYINGWTESAAQEYVRDCVSSFSVKQMDDMFRSGQIKPGSTVAQMEEAQAQVTAAVTALCKCAQDRAMHDFKLDDFVRNGRQPAQMEKAMAACAGDASKERQLPGAGAATPTPTTGPAEAPNGGGEIGYRILLPILAIVALAVWVGWWVWRRGKATRDKRRSG